MSTWNAIYQRADVPADFRPPLEGELPVRKVGEWAEIALPGVETGEAVALELSARVSGEVIWILIQTTASVLAIVHFENGQVVRRLEFSDGEWLTVEGTPREWETWLFSDEMLEDALECGGDEDEVRAVFAEKKLAAGQRLPRPREWDSMWRALGMTREDWMAARDKEPLRTIIGRKTSGITRCSRLLLLGGVSSIACGLAAEGDLRAVLMALGLPLIVLGLATAALRRMRLGRWFF